MNKKLILSLLVLTTSVQCTAGKDDPSGIAEATAFIMKNAPHLLKASAITGTAVGTTSIAQYCMAKYDKGLSKRQKSSIKTVSYAIPTAGLGWIAYEGAKAVLPLLLACGLNFIGATDEGIVKIIATAAAVYGASYFADKTIVNFKDAYYNKKPLN